MISLSVFLPLVLGKDKRRHQSLLAKRVFCYSLIMQLIGIPLLSIIFNFIFMNIITRKYLKKCFYPLISLIAAIISFMVAFFAKPRCHTVMEPYLKSKYTNSCGKNHINWIANIIIHLQSIYYLKKRWLRKIFYCKQLR